MAQSLADEDVEMVEPEGGHHLLQLARSVDRAHKTAFDRLLENHLRALARLFLRILVALGLLHRKLKVLEQFHRRHLQGC
jgi:hypothetical protein